MQKQKQSPNNILGSTRGLTLIELLVTLAIIGILAGLAAPSFVSYGVRNQLSVSSNELTSSIMRARNEAIGKNTCVSLCMSTTVDATGTGTAGPVCATAGQNWQVGWIAFLNPDCNPNYDFAQNLNSDGSVNNQPQNVLFVRQTGSPDVSLVAQNSSRRIFFNARGNPRSTDVIQFNTIYKTNNDPFTVQYASNICLDAMGSTRTIKSSSSCN